MQNFDSVVQSSAGEMLYAEVTDFGFGPAHAVLATLTRWVDRPALHTFSSGNALELLRTALPKTRFSELDCSKPSNWAKFRECVPTGAPVLTMSRAFAAFAADAGYRVGLVDQLDWMWHTEMHWPRPPAFHIVQAYFGDGKVRSRRAQLVSPIVADEFRHDTRAFRCEDTAVIGFGGMSVMGDTGAADKYASWILQSALPVFLDEARCEAILIIGGRADLRMLVPEQWRNDQRVTCVTALPPERYARALRTSRHQVLTPGLATMYECAAMRIAPLLGPGFNKSMLLQLDDLAQTGYCHLVMWPWHAEVCHELRQRSQREGLERIAHEMRESMQTGNAGWLKQMLHRYVHDAKPRMPLSVQIPDLPDGRDSVRRAVSRLVRTSNRSLMEPPKG